MISKNRIRLTAVAGLVVILGGVFALVNPASTVDQVRVDDSAGLEPTVTMRPWSDDLSAQAVDANGIEKDLDGNASALVPSDRLLQGLYGL